MLHKGWTPALLLSLVAASPAESPERLPDPGRAEATLVGTVTVLAAETGPPVAVGAYATRRYRPPAAPGTAGGPQDAVVYLQPKAAAPAPAPEVRTILQRSRTILPHVTVARVGDPVRFPNEDDVFHNLFSLSADNAFNLGRYAPGLSPEHTFESEGVVRLFCDIHAEMAGVILVVDTPWFTRPDADGSYRIDGLPAGAYDVISWHPSAAADTTAVILAAGPPARVDFHLRPRR